MHLDDVLSHAEAEMSVTAAAAAAGVRNPGAVGRQFADAYQRRAVEYPAAVLLHAAGAPAQRLRSEVAAAARRAEDSYSPWGSPAHSAALTEHRRLAAALRETHG